MNNKVSSGKLIFLRVFCAIILLAASEGLRRFFASFKEAPAKIEQSEKVHYINGIKISKQNHRVFLEGYGVIRSAEMINLSSEVAGIVKKVNEKLEPGLIINAGETVFEVDKTDYTLAVNLMKAKMDVIGAQINEAENDLTFAKKSIELMGKEVNLAQKEVERQTRLLKKNIGTSNQKEFADRALLNAENTLLASRQKMSSLKSRIETLKKQKIEAGNAVRIEENRVGKCTVKAQKNLRVVSKDIESGQMLMTGSKVAVLEDSENLEIPVKIPGPDVVRWLNLKEEKTNLFEALIAAPASIFWIENNKETLLATGKLKRIENYSSQNRMVEAVVMLDSVKSVTATGMFCKVQVSGKELKDVFRIPRVALTGQNEVMVIEEGRIKFHSAVVVHTDGDIYMIRSSTLKDSHIFINSKIATPVEGMKVQVELSENEKG